MRTWSIPIAVLVLLLPAAAQAPSASDTQPRYDLQTFSAFRKLILEGDFTPKVTLSAAMAKHPTTGVGALADARGEITIHDGKLIVSYGKNASHPSAENESAALLATAQAGEWQTIKVEQDVAPDDIDKYLALTAAAHGIDRDIAFPFQIRGTLASFVMHVNAEPTNGPHGMGQPIAVTMEIKGNSISGMIAGIYASPDLVGVVSHGGARTHSHWISLDGKSTAHLDSWGLKAGAELSLPKR